jgi:Xaa-Pro aminopeptidase
MLHVLDKSSEEKNHLKNLHNALNKQAIDAVLIRSTDSYFNEYVPKNRSLRALITGFDGSLGDAIITRDKAFLFVDGRYELQAHKQALGFSVVVCKNNQSIEESWASFLPKLLSAGQKLVIMPETIDLALYDKIKTIASSAQFSVQEDASFIKKLFSVHEVFEESTLWPIERSIAGKTVQEKIAELSIALNQSQVDGFLSVKLDDIAWLSNLRGNSFPFQRTFPSIACLFKDRVLLGLASGLSLPKQESDLIKTCTEDKFFTHLRELSQDLRIGIDRSECSKAHEMGLQGQALALKDMKNPIAPLKARKNEQELRHMRAAFKKADHVVYKTQNFVQESFEKGQTLTEAAVDDFVKKAFFASGAKELSFRPICASGKNGAIIHYGTPDHQETIKENDLFLLDTGAYYEGAYATDLTRTFLAGPASSKPKPWQKEMFSLVLKASIRGLSARIRRGTTGKQLDAIVRAPLWAKGLDFAHGTGHGVGINVHEFPPRIAQTSNTELLEGHVFSIEPGLYFEKLGGVRIENLATVVSDKDNPDFLRVLPLTFCPFDERLIDESLLDNDDRIFLDYFKKEWLNDAPMPNLPPLSQASFA